MAAMNEWVIIIEPAWLRWVAGIIAGMGLATFLVIVWILPTLIIWSIHKKLNDD